MYRSKSIALLSIMLVLGTVLGACAPSPAAPAAPAATQPPVTVEVTRIVAGTPQTIVVTATPGPA